MLQVVSLQLFCYITILSHLLLIFSVFFYSALLVLQSNQTFHVKLDTALLLVHVLTTLGTTSECVQAAAVVFSKHSFEPLLFSILVVI